MAQKLRKMKIDEISAVDVGASGTSDPDTRPRIILAKRAPVLFSKFDPEQPRDDHGRWTAGGTAAAIGHHLSSAYHEIKGATEGALRRVGHAVRHTQLDSINPVRGGGIHFHLVSQTANGAKFHTHVQIRPDQFGGGGSAYGPFQADGDNDPHSASAAARAVQAISTVLARSGRPFEDRINGSYKVTFEAPGGGATAASSTLNGRQPTPGRTIYIAPSSNPIPTNQQAQVTPQPQQAINGADIRAAQGMNRESNGLVINTVRGLRVPGTANMFVPLNHDTINADNSGNSSYYTKDEDYVPPGSTDGQKFIESVLSDRDKWAALPVRTPETSNSQAYKTAPDASGKGGGNVVPPGSYDKQQRWEQRYADYADNEDAVLTALGNLARKSPTVSKQLFGSSQSRLFDCGTMHLFKRSPSLFPQMPQRKRFA